LGLTTVMQGFWAILPSFLAPEYTSRVFLSTDCHLFFLFQQALSITSPGGWKSRLYRQSPPPWVKNP
ncbi:MAG: hypothetical protein KME50_09750, partial [Nostoc desertorum CM1-VF14]|nr:hypothetical protein [Nostoc desertorum CM1-VF14]